MKNDIVFELFNSELNLRGYTIKEITDKELLIVEVNGIDISVNLENVRKNYLRDKDNEIIIDFVENVINAIKPTPKWEFAKRRLYLSVEPNEYDFIDVIYEKVTNNICKVLVYFSEEEEQVTCVNETMLEEWEVTTDEAFEVAEKNMDILINNSNIQTGDVHGMKLGMLEAIPIFKASLIFSPSFKDKVSSAIGWPVYVVIPTRDFIFIFSEKDKELLNLVGNSVIKEFDESGYPITKDILHISNNGIIAIGHF